MIDQICRDLEKHKHWLCKLTKHPEDLFQDGVMALLTIDESRIIKLHQAGKIDAYFSRTVKNIAADEYRKREVEIVFTDELDSVPAEMYNLPRTETEIKETLINSIKGYWYDKTIFSLYLEKESVRAVARKTGIPFPSLAKTIKKCKQDILNDFITRKVG